MLDAPSQGRNGCVKLWAAGQTGALDRSQPLHEIRTESFNFCRCAVWAPGGGASRCSAEAGSRAHAEPPAGRLQDVRIACAAHDPADIGVWRPAEAPTAGVLLQQPSRCTKHGMCMSVAFLPTPYTLDAATQVGEGGKSGAEATIDSGNWPACGGSDSAGAGGSGSGSGGMIKSGGSSCGSDCGSSEPWYVVAGYEDGVAALWDVRRPGGPLSTLRVHSEPITCLDVRPATSATTAATNGLTNTSRGLTTSTPDPGTAGGPTAIAGAAAQRRGATASGREGEEGDNGGREGAGRGGRATVETPAVYDMVSGSADDQICCCVVRPSEAQPLALTKKLQLREPGTGDARIRHDRKLFACGCWDGRVRIYSMRRKEPLAVLQYHRGQVTAIAFSPVTNMLATASRDTTVALWSVYSSSTQPR